METHRKRIETSERLSDQTKSQKVFFVEVCDSHPRISKISWTMSIKEHETGKIKDFRVF